MTYSEKLAALLTNILSAVIPNADVAAKAIVREYGALERIFSASSSALSAVEGVGSAGASYLHLVAELLSRRETDKFKFGIKHTDEQIEDYFKALLMTRSVEAVYAMSFDKSWRALSVDLISEGVVNASELLPRKVTEVAVKHGAAYVIIAHNHPHGEAVFSEADMMATVAVAHILSSVGTKLVRHIVTAGMSVSSVDLDKIAQNDN